MPDYIYTSLEICYNENNQIWRRPSASLMWTLQPSTYTKKLNTVMSIIIIMALCKDLAKLSIQHYQLLTLDTLGGIGVPAYALEAAACLQG